MFSRTNFSVRERVFRVAANQRYIVGRGLNILKTAEQVTRVVYLHVILFRIHEKDTATKKEFGTTLEIALEHVLTQRFKQNTKWTAKVTNISKYAQMLQNQGISLKEYF